MKKNILTKEEAIKNATWFYSYSNGDYGYETQDGSLYLIRNGI